MSEVDERGGNGIISPMRRIVTGHALPGVSTILADERIAGTPIGHAGEPVSKAVTYAWSTIGMPCPVAIGPIEPPEVTTFVPSANGSTAGFLDFAPGATSIMHRTETLDYIFLIHGELELEMSDGSITAIRPGMVVIQRGAAHRWTNRRSFPARLAFVALDAKKLGG
jgi:quercetin dioxygenase-like cupin family protein